MKGQSMQRLWFAVLRSVLTLLILTAGATSVAAQTETVEYYGLDALGSIRLIVNPNGQQIDRMDYGPFGENLKSAIRFPTQQFAGGSRDSESGQDYLQARFYNFGAGRLNRPDPVFAAATNPQRLNRYAYALNNPLTFTDPTGLVASFCSAENSFSQCGGGSRFWADDGFGDSYANDVAGGYVDWMPAEMWSALQAHNSRVQEGLAASAANEALRRGDMGTLYQLLAENPGLSFVTLPSIDTAGMSYREAVDAYLKGWGLWDLIDHSTMNWNGHGYTFTFTDRDAAMAILQQPTFASGFLGVLHKKDVGANLDFRSWQYPSSPFSLQVNVGERGRNWADIDRFNPYDVGGFILHGALEVAPWSKKSWPWPCRRC